MSRAHYVYAIVRRDAQLPPSSKSAATSLTKVPWRDLAAVTGRTPLESTPLTTESMLHHEAIVEAVRHVSPALPVRFGTVFNDAAAVASALAERYDELTADLERLGDKVELSITALWTEIPVVDEPAPQQGDTSSEPGAGARYLLGRAADLRRDELLRTRAKVVAQRLDQELGSRAIERRETLLPTPRVAVRVAFLLNPEGVREFRARFEEMCRGRRDVRLLLTGPWPPYSFVTRTETN
jgi:hypothetical protein